MAESFEPLASLLLDEYLNQQDLTADLRVYGRDFVIAATPDRPYILSVLEDLKGWIPPRPTGLKVRVINGDRALLGGPELYGQIWWNYGRDARGNLLDASNLSFDEVDFIEVEPGVTYTIRPFPWENFVGFSQTVNLARGEVKEITIVCEQRTTKNVGGVDKLPEPTSVSISVTVTGGAAVVRPATFDNIMSGDTVECRVWPAKGYFVARVYRPDGVYTDMTWWGRLKKRAAVNAITSIAWPTLVAEFEQCRMRPRLDAKTAAMVKELDEKMKKATSVDAGGEEENTNNLNNATREYGYLKLGFDACPNKEFPIRLSVIAKGDGDINIVMCPEFYSFNSIDRNIEDAALAMESLVEISAAQVAAIESLITEKDVEKNTN